MNTSTTQTNAARDAGQRTQITVRDRTGNIISPGDPDYDMMKAKQESRERRAAAHIGLLTTPAHTPEPWHFISDRIYRTTPAEHIYIAETQPTGRGNATEMISNARRIVECVNACEGMTDPAKEIAALRACAERLADYVEWHKGAIPSSERDDYEREYLIEGSESLIALAGKGDK